MTDKYDAKTNYVITAIMMILAAGAGSVVDLGGAEDALENWYICDVSLETGEFARLSGTEYTGYPNELDSKGYKRCNTDEGAKGTWQPIVEYAEANGINLEDLVQDPAEDAPEEPETPQDGPGVWGQQYSCSNDGCVPI